MAVLIGKTMASVAVPVVVKEVGFGMSRETIQQLLAIGVQTIDVAGSGGTSFTQIENARRKRELAYLDTFGQSTVISCWKQMRSNSPLPASLQAEFGMLTISSKHFALVPIA